MPETPFVAAISTPDNPAVRVPGQRKADFLFDLSFPAAGNESVAERVEHLASPGVEAKAPEFPPKPAPPGVAPVALTVHLKALEQPIAGLGRGPSVIGKAEEPATHEFGVKWNPADRAFRLHRLVLAGIHDAKERNAVLMQDVIDLELGQLAPTGTGEQGKKYQPAGSRTLAPAIRVAAVE